MAFRAGRGASLVGINLYALSIVPIGIGVKTVWCGHFLFVLAMALCSLAMAPSMSFKLSGDLAC